MKMRVTQWMARLVVGSAVSACASAGAWAQQINDRAQGAEAVPAEVDSGGATPPDAPASATLVSDIVVTAERRAERLNSLPIAISAYSTDTLKDRGVADLNALSLLSPSIRVPENANGGLGVNIVIRGVGSFGGFAGRGGAIAGQAASVGGSIIASQGAGGMSGAMEECQ